MRDWTESRTLVNAYTLYKLISRYWLEISYTGAVFTTGFYFGTLAKQFA